MGGFAPEGRNYLNGLYWGLYWLHERPDEHFAAAYLGGRDEDYDVLKHNASRVVSGSSASYQAMLNRANADLRIPENYQLMQEILDVPDLIDYLIMNYYVGNSDWAHHNWYASRNRVDPNGRWRYHSWDAEHIMEGLFEDVTGRISGGSPTDLHRRLLANDEYSLRFADHVHRHFFNHGILTPDAITGLYRVRLDEVVEAVLGESARWGDNHRTTPYTRDIDWIGHRDWLLNDYFPQRTVIVLNQFSARDWYPDIDAPIFFIDEAYQHGGYVASGATLSMVNPQETGDIYYSLDGSDPGPKFLIGAAPVIGLYSGPVTLTKSAWAKARLFQDQESSALNEALYAVGPVKESLRISELMYHPPDPNQEFIELTNIGVETIKLTLVRFTNGIAYRFGDTDLEPGARLLLVRDIDRFAASAGPSIPILGPYTGNLSNRSERIKLVDALGVTILDFRYDDGWYGGTDGDGLSLEVVDVAHADPSRFSEKQTWRPSLDLGESPGR